MEWPVLKCFAYDGKLDAKKLRREGFVPFMTYYKNSEPEFFKARKNEIIRFFVHHGGKIHLEIDIDGVGKKKAVFKEIQRDPVSNEVIHMDLYELKGDDAFKVKLPLKFKGTPQGTRVGGSFERQTNYLNVMMSPKNFVEEITADVEHLKVGDCLYLEELPVPEGIKFLDMQRKLLCNVVVTRVAKETEEGAESEETEASEE